MKYYIITGTSKGLGEALALELLIKGHHVIGVSRSQSDKIEDRVRLKNDNWHHITWDISHIEKLTSLMEAVFSCIDFKQALSICLINNAGVVTPVKVIEKCEDDEIMEAFNINTMAPILMTSKFIKKLKSLEIDKHVVNISSGAGKHPYDGWSCYCSTKAAMDMFTRCVALEQKKTAFPVKIISLAPGVVDTQMQGVIRASTKEDFSNVERFIDYKEKGSLLSPEAAAKKILEVMEIEAMSQGQLLDIRDYK
ncbi:(S)-benzoin forming benzil reductase [Petrocella sp. FN5]|uniref:(S)-benzoin forming benzil reductase n=1 Tax=Petrocella sp. FN5 TaxID=3032002 RepID=UPI0023DBA22D|nr:(S)-benzoin forming benzil reductase [Petrocella sp. FN5]MDF1617660.1 (S)-benzoin forming benzil reductase [Petrocella sp. FN5]